MHEVDKVQSRAFAARLYCFLDEECSTYLGVSGYTLGSEVGVLSARGPVSRDQSGRLMLHRAVSRQSRPIRYPCGTNPVA